MQELAQRALVAYVRSIFLQPNKAVFDASALPAAEFALSMGLTSVPKLRFLKRHGPKKTPKVPGLSPGTDLSFLQVAVWPSSSVAPVLYTWLAYTWQKGLSDVLWRYP